MIFGLTGGIASGKSTVSRTFIESGIPMIDADVVAREVVEVGSLGLQLVVEKFGKQYLLPDGSLDRSALGHLVFGDVEKLEVLNQILWPLIYQASRFQLTMLSREHLIVGYDAALLIDNGTYKEFSPIVLVGCPSEIQLERLMRRNQLTFEQAICRLEAQLPLEDKKAKADYYIDTSGSVEYSKEQTLAVIELLKKL